MESGLSEKIIYAKHFPTNNVYVCKQCGNTLFQAATKFEAGCGFPSFWQQSGGVTEKLLQTYGRTRIQLLCSQCGQHLGHLFNSKHTSTGLRYCINADTIVLQQLDT